jgi:hypothetical protein
LPERKVRPPKRTQPRDRLNPKASVNVMPALVAGIHVFRVFSKSQNFKT